jgi:hypothetical protein
MQFLKRKKEEEQPQPLLVPEAPFQQYALKLYLMARSSDSVRMRGGEAAGALTQLVDGLSSTRIEVIAPLPLEYGAALPRFERIEELEQWTQARKGVGPIARHALYVLESVDALDMTVDTFVCGLLRGETDASGYPDYQAVVGGVASRWDESNGDLLARAVVAWGGKGVRGDTERNAQALIDQIYAELVASGYSMGTANQPKPMVHGDRSGLICAHCGFERASSQAFFCSRCGMRMSRGA